MNAHHQPQAVRSRNQSGTMSSSNSSLLAGRGGEEEGADDHEELSLLAGEDGGGDDEWGIESRAVAAQRQPVRGYIPRLYIVCLSLFFGCFTSYSLRVCISVAAAPSSPPPPPSPAGPATGGGLPGTSMYDDFGWDGTTKGLVLSSFFWGYLPMQIPGGLLAKRFGGRDVLALSTALAATFTILTPVSASIGLPYLVACRVSVGLFSAMAYPSTITLLGRWVPQAERSACISFVFAGSHIGTLATLPASAFIMERYGWRSIFTLLGLFGLAFSASVMALVTADPSTHSGIHVSELKRIKAGTPPLDEGSRPIPWAKIFRSGACWALFFGHVANNWGTYLMLTQMPSYLATVLGFDAENAGLVAAIPYMCQFVLSMLGGFIADWLIDSGSLSRTNTRKLFQTMGLMVPGIALVACGYATSVWGAVTLMAVSVGSSGFANSGFISNYLEVSSDLGGVILSAGNTFATLPGIFAPAITGYIQDRDSCSVSNVEGCKKAFQETFWLALLVDFVGAAVYCLFATSERVIHSDVEKEGQQEEDGR